jgi:tetratricopeptide (TPR) repeat protein
MCLGPKTRSSVLAGALLALAAGCQTTGDPLAATKPKSSLSSLFRARTVSAQMAEPEPELVEDVRDPTDLNLAYARWMEDVGNLIVARQKYGEVAEAKPKNLEAALGLARIDQLSGRSHEAEQGFLRAHRLAPDAPETLHALGKFYSDEGRWPEAVEQLNKAMLAAPAERQYRYDLAVALVHTGDVDAALPHFFRTVGDAEAHYNVGLILKEMGQTREAEEHLLLAVTKRPDLHQAQYWLDEVRRLRDTSPSSRLPMGGVQTAELQQQSSQIPTVTPTTGGHSTSFAPTTGGLTPQQLQQRQNQRPAQW